MAEKGRVVIPAPKIVRAQIELESMPGSSLIVHKFSEKVQRQILEDQTKGGKVKTKKRDPKDVNALYHDSYYRHPAGGYGLPSIWFKLAAVRAGTMLGIPMTESRQSFFVVGERGEDGTDLIKVKGKPRVRIDPVRLNGKTADMRVRAEFPTWSAVLVVEFMEDAISLDELVNLIDRAGFCNGVGEWRPQRSGTHGRFTVKKS